MSATVYVPGDAGALSLGADEVATAISREASHRGLDVRIVRNGSRGLLWLETLVEVATDAGRVAYGPVEPEDVAGLFDAGWLQGGAHALCQGPTEQIPYLARQDARPRGDWSIVDITYPMFTDPRGPLYPADAPRVKAWAYRGRPVFTYVEDRKPGDIWGEASQGLWGAGFFALRNANVGFN